MNTSNLSAFVKQVRLGMLKRAPEILTAVGITGMITTTVLAVKATPKAIRLLDKKKEELETDSLTPAEVVKTTWKCYIPAAVVGATSIGCMIGATTTNSRRNAALAAACKISETAFTEYREKVVETVGEKKEREIREKVSQQKVDDHPVSQSQVYITDMGETLFCEPVSKRYFKHDITKIKKIINELNRQMMYDMGGSISLTDFYYEIGLERTGVSDYIGWNIVDGLIDIDLNPGKDENDNPCLILDYVRPPKHDFE